jgi:hypothetical protein
VVHKLTGDLEGDLISPSIDLRHGDIVHEDAKSLVSQWLVIFTLLLDFRLNRLLEVARKSIEREVNSLEVVLSSESHLVHEDNGSLGSTWSSHKQSVLASSLLSLLRSERVKTLNLLDKEFGSGGVWSWDQEL